VIGPVDGHDVDGIDRAISDAGAAGRPTRIVARTVIGKGAPNQAGSEKAHGEALGVSEVAATRRERGPDLDFAGCRCRGPAPDEDRGSMKVSMGLR
jgi:transketolase